MPLQLLGPADLASEIDGFLLRSPKPSSTEIAAFLRLYAGQERNEAARALINKGVSPNAVGSALTWLDSSSRLNVNVLWGVLSLISMAASAVHGYRRNQSIGWGLWWGLMGTTFPVITPALAVAQGFGRRKGS